MPAVWIAVPWLLHALCGCAQAGSLFSSVAGYLVDGRAAVRVFNPGPVPNYSLVATMVNATSGMHMNRWYASVVTMPDTTIAILGGSTVRGSALIDNHDSTRFACMRGAAWRRRGCARVPMRLTLAVLSICRPGAWHHDVSVPAPRKRLCTAISCRWPFVVLASLPAVAT
jgi:hypothetical protein